MPVFRRAAFGVFDDEDDALAFLATMEPPYVIKTDGLAAGKGVLVTHDFDEACARRPREIEWRVFGGAGHDRRHRGGPRRARSVH